MNILYKRENHKSYLVLKDADLEEKIGGRIEESQAYDLRMLCNNPISGLLPISVHMFNGETELYYDISTKQSLSVLYEKREMRKEDLEKLFYGMKSALKNMENYLLNMECLILEPEYIYIHAADETIYFLYHPYMQENFEQTVYNFAEYLLERICNEDEQAVVYAYGFYRYIKEEKGDLSEALNRLLTEREVTGSSEEQTMAETKSEDLERDVLEFYPEDEDILAEQNPEMERKVPQETYFLAKMIFFAILGLGGIGILIFQLWENEMDWNLILSQKESVAGIGMIVVGIVGILLFGWMEVMRRKESECGQTNELLENSNRDSCEKQIPLPFTYEEILEEPDMKVAEEISYETVLLEENCYHEQRILTGRVRGKRKQIDLSAFPFIIGKSNEQADYVLEDSSISRIHARFTLRDDIVYLTDLNSTNGTCKNGIRLEPNELVMLEAEDEITFGRVTFTYH
jgi:hypothetical protein